MFPRHLLENLARHTWRRIRDGHRFKIRQGEVALTDYLLLELAREGSPHIRVVETGLRVEASQGIDWEWWVGSRTLGWIRYAIQAKRLSFPEDIYTALVHKVQGRLQVQTLMEYAGLNQAVPLYCFFNSTDEPKLEDYWHCCVPPFEREQFGCTVAHALVVKEALRRKPGSRKTFQAIHESSTAVPWRCLVRCPAVLSAYRDDGKGLPVLPPGESATIHPALPPALHAALEKGEIDQPGDELFRGKREYFPRYLAVVELS